MLAPLVIFERFIQIDDQLASGQPCQLAQFEFGKVWFNGLRFLGLDIAREYAGGVGSFQIKVCEFNLEATGTHA